MRHRPGLPANYVKSHFYCTAELDTLKGLKTLYPLALTPHLQSRVGATHYTEYVE